jgi:hypothetical protein
LRFFGGGFAAYKTIGLFLLLMTWFYFLARIVVLGGELNAFLRPVAAPAADEEGRERAPVSRPEGPAGCAEPARHTGLGSRVVRLAMAGGLVMLLIQRLRRGDGHS